MELPPVPSRRAGGPGRRGVIHSRQPVQRTGRCSGVRRGTQYEQGRSVWNRPDRRSAPGYGSWQYLHTFRGTTGRSAAAPCECGQACGRAAWPPRWWPRWWRWSACWWPGACSTSRCSPPTGEGALGNANTARLAALAALLATGLMHLLLLSCVGFRWYEWRAMRPRKGEVCGVGLVRQC